MGAVLAVALSRPPTAAAHANLASAEPAPGSVLDASPTRVAAWFTEPIEPGLSEIRVMDASGARVDDGTSVVDRNDQTAMSVGLAPIPEGTYTVAWKNVSTVDGHLVRGSFLFSVGEPISGGQYPEPGQPLLQSPAEPVVRWLLLLSVLAMVGGLAFDLLVLRPVMLDGQSDGPLRDLGRGLRSRSQGLLWLAIGLFLASSVAQLLVQTAATYEVSLPNALTGPVVSMITATEWGRLWAWRIAMALGLALSLGVLGLRARKPDTEEESGARQVAVRLLALAFGGALLWTLSLTSHGAATTAIRSAALLVDYLHLLAAAFWVGALFHLALAIPLVLRSPSVRRRAACLSAIVPRFSVVAALSVATLIATGVFSAWAQVTVAPALATPYGLALVTKLALVVPLLALGGLNLLWVRPRLAHDSAGERWLRRFVSGEAALAVLVLASVGVLTSLEPARQVAARQGKGVPDSLRFEDTVEGTAMALEIRPGRVGPNVLSLALKDRLSDPITNASDVSLRLVYLEADLGEEAAAAVSVGGGAYVLEGAQMSIAGPWQVEVLVRRPDAFDARTAFRFDVAAVGAGGSASIAPSPDTANILLGSGLALLGMVFMATGLSLGGWYTRAGAGVMVPGVIGFLSGAALLVNSQLVQIGGQERNPFPPNPDSLQAGQAVYEQRCLTCHGVSGRGDGPAGLLLNPPAADLVVHVPLHPDQDLFRFVHDGIPGTAMAPLGERLTDEEIWHVVNYVKTFGE